MDAKLTYAIKFVADMDKALAFYRDTFGLTVRMATPFWSEFDTGAVTLALHPANEKNPAGGVEIGFSTANLAQIYAERAVNASTFPRRPAWSTARSCRSASPAEGRRCRGAATRDPGGRSGPPAPAAGPEWAGNAGRLRSGVADPVRGSGSKGSARPGRPGAGLAPRRFDLGARPRRQTDHRYGARGRRQRRRTRLCFRPGRGRLFPAHPRAGLVRTPAVPGRATLKSSCLQRRLRGGSAHAGLSRSPAPRRRRPRS